jgi:ABC-type multidrug transport system fused ATPase/permease subunit
MTDERRAAGPAPRRLARVLASLALLAMLAMAVSGVLDRPAEQYTARAFTRAMVTFGVARTLNGVISVVQETEVSLQPAGVGLALMPGELLDPVNDLIERFSWVMLASAVSLGMQSTLMTMSAWWVMDILVVISVLVMLLTLWRGGRPGVLAVLLQRAATLVLFLRFLVPVLLLVTGAVSALFLQGEQVHATAQLVQTADEVAAIARQVEEQATPASPDQSLIERLGTYMGDRLTELDLGQRIERARAAVGETADQVVALTASFLLETVLLPLLLLWLGWQLLRWLLSLPRRA